MKTPLHKTSSLSGSFFYNGAKINEGDQSGGHLILICLYGRYIGG